MSGRYLTIDGQKMFIGFPAGKLTKEDNAHIDMIDLINGNPLNETHNAFIDYLAKNVKDCPGVPVPIIIETMLKTGCLRVSLVGK